MTPAGSDPVDRARLWAFRIWAAIGTILLLAGLGWLLWEPLGVVLPPLALAVVIVYLLNPFVRVLARRGVPRVVGTGIAYLVLIGVAVAGSYSLGPLIADQVAELADDAPEIAVQIQDALNAALARFGVSVELDLSPESVRETLQQYLVGEQARGQLSGIISGAGSVAREVLHIAVIVLLGPVLAFYLLADLPGILAGLRGLIPPDQRSEVVRIIEGVGTRVGGYFRGQLLIATFVGLATSLGLWIVDLPFWALVGLVTGIFNIVPLIGPFVGALIGVIVALTVGGDFDQAALVVLVMVVVQQIDNHIISPNVMSRTVDLHPITVMLALLVAASLYGILGMLVAVPAVAAAKLIGLHLLATRVPWAAAAMSTPITIDAGGGD